MCWKTPSKSLRIAGLEIDPVVVGREINFVVFFFQNKRPMRDTVGECFMVRKMVLVGR